MSKVKDTELSVDELVSKIISGHRISLTRRDYVSYIRISLMVRYNRLMRNPENIIDSERLLREVNRLDKLHGAL